MKEWIKICKDTLGKPEVMQMGAALKLAEETVLGHLVRVWCWADDQYVVGHAVCVTDAAIDRIAQCANFAAQLRKVGWLVGEEGNSVFMNFHKHNGESAKKRTLDAERQQTNRSRKRHADSVTNQLPDKKKNIYSPPKSMPPKGGGVSELFMLFWKAYPQRGRINRRQAYRIWTERHLGNLAERIVAHVEALKGGEKWMQGIVPNATTYLNQRRWEDEVAAPAPAQPRMQW